MRSYLKTRKEEKPMIHELKVWPEFFDALANQTKNFEVRKNDRGFRVRDELLLKEYDTEKGFTGF